MSSSRPSRSGSSTAWQVSATSRVQAGTWAAKSEARFAEAVVHSCRRASMQPPAKRPALSPLFPGSGRAARYLLSAGSRAVLSIDNPADAAHLAGGGDAASRLSSGSCRAGLVEKLLGDIPTVLGELPQHGLVQPGVHLRRILHDPGRGMEFDRQFLASLRAAVKIQQLQ